MPSIPKRHNQKPKQEYRRQAHERGYDSRWTKLRNRIIQDQPVCRLCKEKGFIVPTEIIDHIVPVHVAPQLRLEATNLQGLCRSCHTVKTNEDLKRYGSAR